MMKKCLMFVALTSSFAWGSQIFAAEQAAPAGTVINIQPKNTVAIPTAQPAPAVQPEYESLNNPAACFARGLANVSSCWLEIPRCAIYDNAEVPFFGLIVGIPEGAMFTVARAFTGVADIVSFGTIGDSIHGRSYPDFVWEANWLPPKRNKK